MATEQDTTRVQPVTEKLMVTPTADLRCSPTCRDRHGSDRARTSNSEHLHPFLVMDGRPGLVMKESWES